jgi:Tol biopolymer transport system component
MRLRRWAPVAVSAVTVFACLASFVQVGVRIRALSTLSPFGDASSPDYSRLPRGFRSLDADFVSRVLGISIQQPIAAPPPAATGEPVQTVRDEGFDVPHFTDVHPLTNDDFANARPVSGGSFTAKTNTKDAKTQPGEPAECSGVGGTVWYRYTPRRDISLYANTFGSGYGTVLGVFTRSGSEWTSAACDSDRDGNALVQFDAERGTTYFFRIAAQTSGGDLVFNVEPQGDVKPISVSRAGRPGNGGSGIPSISDDGRFVAFESSASDLGPAIDSKPCPLLTDAGNAGYDRFRFDGTSYFGTSCSQIYVYDRRLNTMEIVSVDVSGEPGRASSDWAHISGNGRFVAFRSQAANLVPEDTNHASDIFVHDRVMRTTELISVSTLGEQATIAPPRGFLVDNPSISDDGRLVAFESIATNLVPGDTNASPDVFVRDRVRRTTERVSVSSTGEEARPFAQGLPPTGESELVSNAYGFSQMAPSISSTGRWIVFHSAAGNLVENDEEQTTDTFVRDRLTGRTERISVTSSGASATRAEPDVVDASIRHAKRPAPAGNGDLLSWAQRWNISSMQSISRDGRYAIFVTGWKLVDDDTNESADVYVRDRTAGRTWRVSVSSDGEQAEGLSFDASISDNGRYISFSSSADNLAQSRTGVDDLFVYDLRTHTTRRLPVVTEDQFGEAGTYKPAISADGSVIAYEYRCVRCDLGYFQVVVLDRRTPRL